MSTNTNATLDDVIGTTPTEHAGGIGAPNAAGRDLPGFWPILRLRARLIAAITVGTVITAAALLALLPAKYAATAVLLVDPRQPKVTNSEVVLSGIGSDAAAVESQVELIGSADLAKRVIAQLGLADDPEFAAKSTIERVGDVLSLMLGRDLQKDAATQANRLLYRFRKGLEVRRRGLTYILEVTYQSTTAVKAALANAVAEAYLDDQRTARTEITVHASEWLEARIAEMRDRVRDSEHAVAEFKAANNIFDVTQGNKLIDRQVEDLERQLALSGTRAADAQSRMEQVQKAAQRTQDPAALNEALRSPVIADLRSQYAQTARTEAEYGALLGPRHPTLGSVRAQLMDLRRQINDEIARILGGLRNDYEVARSLETKLEAQLTGLKQQSAQFKQAEVRLHELEREADANRALFEQFLARAKMTGEQRSLQIADARVVSAALTPISPNRPAATLLLMMALVCGTVLGVGCILVMEQLRRGFRSSDEIERVLSVPSLGVLPRLPVAGGFRGRFLRASATPPPCRSRDRSRRTVGSARRSCIRRCISLCAESAVHASALAALDAGVPQ